uniref:Uncharacterized protein n=1 Tax=Rhizophora mucronata TaxID=61149 RepID=A0A2P2Q9H8_RHIMU
MLYMAVYQHFNMPFIIWSEIQSQNIESYHFVESHVQWNTLIDYPWPQSKDHLKKAKTDNLFCRPRCSHS